MKRLLSLSVGMCVLGVGLASAATVTLVNTTPDQVIGVQYQVCQASGDQCRKAVAEVSTAPVVVTLTANETELRVIALSSTFLPAKDQPWFVLPSDQCKLSGTGTIRVSADAHHITCSHS